MKYLTAILTIAFAGIILGTVSPADASTRHHHRHTASSFTLDEVVTQQEYDDAAVGQVKSTVETNFGTTGQVYTKWFTDTDTWLYKVYATDIPGADDVRVTYHSTNSNAGPYHLQQKQICDSAGCHS